MTYRSAVLLAVLTAVLCTGAALGQQNGQQNVLVNGGFELNPPPNFGNNSPYSTAPWTLVSDFYANVVKVDGPGGNDYGSDGPESDASAPGAGIAQHYLDVVGPLRFHQTFTPQCSGRVEFGGSFSTRGNSPGSGNITIRHGAGLNGTIVAQASTGNLPGGVSRTDPWKTVTSFASVTAFQTYSFVVDLHDNLNFDNAFVACEAVDPCCPPWTVSMLEQVLFYQGTGSITAPYLLKYQPVPAFSAQMQAYIEYLHSVNPAINQITINFRLHDGGTGNAPVKGAQIGADHFVTWTAGGPAPAPQNFFVAPSQLMQINQWYVVHTGIYLEGGHQFFDANCADNDIGVRVQVLAPLPILRTPPPPVLQFLRKGRAMIEKPLC